NRETKSAPTRSIFRYDVIILDYNTRGCLATEKAPELVVLSKANRKGVLHVGQSTMERGSKSLECLCMFCYSVSKSIDLTHIE
uniref:Uncharacterized protein n=1 Tax=Ciona intestinalis TaxID=7719 RepID=H2XY75_CIOIN